MFYLYICVDIGINLLTDKLFHSINGDILDLFIFNWTDSAVNDICNGLSS